MQDIVGPVRQKPYIQGADPSLSQPREQLRRPNSILEMPLLLWVRWWASPLEVEGLLRNPRTPGGGDGRQTYPAAVHAGV